MISLEVSTFIRAPKAVIFEIIKDPLKLLRFTRGVESVEVLESDKETTLVHFLGRFGWLKLSSVHRAFLKPPHKLRFRQVTGDFKSLKGAYTLEEGQGGTWVTYTVDFDLGIPLVGALWAKQAMKTMALELLEGIRREAEERGREAAIGSTGLTANRGGRNRHRGVKGD
ncbi:MAG: type II toxin-antitoxin system RatA family toxin [Candidatus Methylomirabilales bacterium]